MGLTYVLFSYLYGWRPWGTAVGGTKLVIYHLCLLEALNLNLLTSKMYLPGWPSPPGIVLIVVAWSSLTGVSHDLQVSSEWENLTIELWFKLYSLINLFWNLCFAFGTHQNNRIHYSYPQVAGSKYIPLCWTINMSSLNTWVVLWIVLQSLDRIVLEQEHLKVLHAAHSFLSFCTQQNSPKYLQCQQIF